MRNGALQGLKKIANLGFVTHDLDFLRYLVGIANSHRLQQLSILLPTSTPGVTKIHDLVCMAVCDLADGKELARAVEEYVGKQKGEMMPSVLREIHLANGLLKAEHARRGQRDPDWLSYALLQVESDAKQALHDKSIAKRFLLACLFLRLCASSTPERHTPIQSRTEMKGANITVNALCNLKMRLPVLLTMM